MTPALTILAILGVTFAVHSLCTANFMPERAPTVYGLVVALMSAGSVGVTVFSLLGDGQMAWKLFAFTVFLKAIMLLGAKMSGFPVKGITIFQYVKRPLTNEEAHDSGWHWGYGQSRETK